MTFALSHRSLAQFWHNARLIEGAVNAQNELLRKDAARNGYHNRPQERPLPPQAASILASQPRIAPSADMKLSYGRTELQSFAQVHNLDMPLDLMVFSQTRRNRSAAWRCHLASALVGIPCLLETNGMLIGSPELCALQICSSLNILELTRQLYEICGAYVLDPTNPRGFAVCSPLTNQNSCLELIEAAGKQKGKKRLSKLLKSMPRGNSASPRETALTMLLALPPDLGGYGLVPTGLNTRISLGQKARTVYGKKSCVCDLLFDTLDVEYDSAMEHENALSGVSDSLRSTALAFEGIEVMHVYAENLKTLDRTDSLASSIARKLGSCLEIDQSREGRATREHLRREVFRPHRSLI